MASSKVMSTTSPTNPDLPRQPSLCSSLSTLLADLQNQQLQQQQALNMGDSSSHNLGSMSMDDLLKNIYASPPPTTTDAHTHAHAHAHAHAPFHGASISREGSFSLPKEVANKSVDEVWKEIVAGGDQRQGGAGEGSSGGAHSQALEEMTLEDFLTKAGAVREEDVRGVQVAGGFTVDARINGSQYQGFGNGAGPVVDRQRVVGAAGGVGGRGKRRAVEEPPLDKATQQKQRRMIKNRESAARSRERKQAYTVELESLVTQLEEENARLLREEDEQKMERLKQLMENLIPVEEKRRPPRALRRVHSLQW